MRIQRAMFGTGCVLLLAGCDLGITGLGAAFGGNCGFMGEGCHSPVALELEPSLARFLRGDTVLILARSDSGHSKSNWKISGAARFVDNGTLTDQMAGSGAVRVRLLEVGTATIEATSTNSTHRATGTYVVADSSAISALSFWQLTSDSLRMPKSYQTWIFCDLRDAAGNWYSARPTSWSSSDPAVATIVQDSATHGCAGIIRTRAAGLARLTANFLGVSATVRAYVSP